MGKKQHSENRGIKGTHDSGTYHLAIAASRALTSEGITKAGGLAGAGVDYQSYQLASGDRVLELEERGREPVPWGSWECCRIPRSWCYRMNQSILRLSTQMRLVEVDG